MDSAQIESIEIGLLIDGIHKRWGYDFSHYSQSSIRRRLKQACIDFKFHSFSEMIDRTIHDQVFFDSLLKYLSITVTEMFRDPETFRVIREKVIPNLKTFPFVKVWNAGCATGEEAYTTAIIFSEEDFLSRIRIYATDFNKLALTTAEKGVYPSQIMKKYAENYLQAGGKQTLEDYYTLAYDFAKMRDFLKERITFSYHNLVTDGIFGEMNLIFCRNVLIYFDKKLQERALDMFTKSLRHGGYLCLGSKETLNFTDVKKYYDIIDADHKIYRKNKISL